MSRDHATRIAIIGDVHAHHDHLHRVLRWLEDNPVDQTLCTGDLADGAGCLATCCDLLMSANVATVAGNHDRWLKQNRVRHVDEAHFWEELDGATRRFFDDLPSTREVATQDGLLLLCHGVAERDMAKVWPGSERLSAIRSDRLDALLSERRYRFIVNGHTHFRHVIDFEHTQVINAGALVGPRPGFVCLDMDAERIESYDLDEAGIRLARTVPLIDPERPSWQTTQDFDHDWNPALLYGT